MNILKQVPTPVWIGFVRGRQPIQCRAKLGGYIGVEAVLANRLRCSHNQGSRCAAQFLTDEI